MTALSTGLRAPHTLPEGTDLGAELCGPDPYPAYHRLRRDDPVLVMRRLDRILAPLPPLTLPCGLPPRALP
ncbi:MAG TPA: hypothetical protein VFA45_20250 [Actinomycetes bacterium]|jgi:hypothetical protein|nr:hypothetical protein [Actinomycetes bacterium]